MTHDDTFIGPIDTTDEMRAMAERNSILADKAWPAFTFEVGQYISRTVNYTVEERVQYVFDEYDNEPGMATVFTWWDENGDSNPDDFVKQMHLLADDIVAWVEKRFVVASEWQVSDGR